MSAALGAVFAWAGACSTTVGDGESESHFLARCDGECPSGLECVCGVCTEACEDDDACSALYAGAACLRRADCSVRACDVLCDGHEACDGLSAGAACVDGFCRSGAPIPRDAAADAVVADGPVPDARGDEGRVDAAACCLHGTLVVEESVGGPGPFVTGYHVFSDCREHRWSGGSEACTDEVPACGSEGLDVSDLIEALRHPDVTAAFAAAPVTYNRTVEGEGTRLQWNGAMVFFGAFACEDGGACTPAPEGVRALIERVREMEEQGAICSTGEPDAGIGGGAPCDPSQCEGCGVEGPFGCCLQDGTCGCTWATGGYCL